MATGGLSGVLQPPLFLQEPGEPPVPWKNWISLFQTYIVATETKNSVPPRFQQRSQHPGETIDNYVAALRELIKQVIFTLSQTR
ncbi:uncharacterized protein LOC110983496 [Acanthaster planci]|uniref:Uncharacterized protein LOC110983496 n=1 Tax=Acanthaster planci TaxID=133434 RepID=A0A8B7Z578_ACAPL|nr:uncharacterized protein LOC110983496 [Acanthaster planci]